MRLGLICNDSPRKKYSPLINFPLINDTFQAEYLDILKPSNKRKYQGLDENGGKIELKKVRIFCFTFKSFFGRKCYIFVSFKVL